MDPDEWNSETDNPLYRELEAMGDSRHEVRVELRRLGITGKPRWPSNCPLAERIKAWEDVDNATVLANGCVHVRLRGERGVFEARLPEPCDEFQYDFDEDPHKYIEICDDEWLRRHPEV